MKSLSIACGVMATALVIVCTAAGPKKSFPVMPVSPSPVEGSLVAASSGATPFGQKFAAPLRRLTYYYWYSVPGDVYNDYNDMFDEAGELEVELQENVNNDPFGGTLIEAGYINNQYPHMIRASVFLYAHPN